MSIGSRIKDARIRKNLTQRELAALVGVTNGAIANYEAGTSSPKEPVMFKLLEALEVDANYLFQDGYESPTDEFSITPSELKLVRSYRELDDWGRGSVDSVLAREHDRCRQASALAQSYHLDTIAAHADPDATTEELDDALSKLLSAHPEFGD